MEGPPAELLPRLPSPGKLSAGGSPRASVGYGLGLRHDVAVLPAEERTFLAFDFARLSLGADFYPMPSWGFGPFIETDVGVLAGEAGAFYALFHAGLRFAFGPMSAGTILAPALARR
ncbi:MAG: hypothetical protein HY744_30805 [Deltaproteobacteria bacterium]|nr:hypothetical protein [Deltaproteobacteria bacterium]